MKAIYIFSVFLIVLTYVPITVILICWTVVFGFIACLIDAILAKPNLFRKYAMMPLKAYKKLVLSFFDTARPTISK